MIQLDFNIGDIIRAYHKGYWRVTSIERRYWSSQDEKHGYGKTGEEYNSLVYYELVMDASFNKPKNKPRINSCDAGFCKKVKKEDLEKQLCNFENNIKKLIEILENK